MSGVQLLEWVRQHYPKTVRLLMTGFAELEEAVEAINRGQVFRYIFKPWRSEELLETLRNAARTFLLERSHEQLLEELRQLNLELEQRVHQRTRELEEANHELEQKNKMLEKLALTDPLTALPNRRAMDRLAEREAAPPRPLPQRPGPGPDRRRSLQADQRPLPAARRRQGAGGPGQVPARLAAHVDLLGRIGGEEFLVIAPETNMEGAGVLGERIRATVASTCSPTRRDHPGAREHRLRRGRSGRARRTTSR